MSNVKPTVDGPTRLSTAPKVYIYVNLMGRGAVEQICMKHCLNF